MPQDLPATALATPPATASGLEGIMAAETCLSDVDGEAGHLVIAGDDVEALGARGARFEEVVAALLAAAGASPPAELGARLGAARTAAWAQLPQLAGALAAADGMDALRGAIGQLPGQGDLLADGVALLGAAPVVIAAWARARRGLPAIAPDATLGHAADFLRMLGDDAPPPARIAALDAYLVTVSDHGMNASTFTARVVASTGADAISAVTAAIGALKGPLHGGAPGPVLDMLDAIGAPARARPWLEAELAAGRRVMGMGHRIYRVRDPRAAVLEQAAARLAAAGGAVATPRLALARAVEDAAASILRERKPDRPLAANVEFYTAVLLDAIGLDRALFSPVFAMARTAGWVAHVLEQRRVGKLIRPQSRYVGARPVAAPAEAARRK